MTPLRSLALRTDLLAMGSLSVVEEAGEGALALRTPAEPDFWWGNALIRLTPPEPPAREEARFRRAFPEAGHLALVWDDPATDPDALRALWAGTGAEVEVEDVLGRDARTLGPPAPRAFPDGYGVRALDPACGEDWAQSLAVHLAAAPEGFGGPGYEAYLRRRVDARRALAAQGRLRWFGAFRNGRLAAQMGLAEGDDLGRFQSVDTHPDHRRRGLCGALLAHVTAQAREPRLVIVAEAGGEAGRIYRRGGFAFVERVVGVERGG